MKRRSISLRTRFHVLQRDGFKCRYCGARPPYAVLVIDHQVPVAAGGGNDVANLAAACEECNQGKATQTVQPAAPTGFMSVGDVLNRMFKNGFLGLAAGRRAA